MFEEIIKEIEAKKAQKHNNAKQAMIDEMKGHTLEENVARIMTALAHLGLKKTMELMVPSSDYTKEHQAFDRGGVAVLTSVCEALQTALENSKTT